MTAKRWIIDESKAPYAEACSLFDVDEDFVRNSEGEVRWVQQQHRGGEGRVFLWRKAEHEGQTLNEADASEWCAWARGRDLELVKVDDMPREARE